MMKKSFMMMAAMTVAFALAPVSQATRIEEGTLETGVRSDLVFINERGSLFDGDLSAGYFIRDGISLGGRMETYIDRYFTMLGLFGTIEQHLELESALVPYLGTDLGVTFINFSDSAPNPEVSSGGKYSIHSSRWDGDKDNREIAFVAVLRGGVKWYLTEDLALDTNLSLALATGRIYAQKNREPGNVNVALRVGLRYCLF